MPSINFLPSPNGTYVSITPDKAIVVDASGNLWTLTNSATKGFQVTFNGTVDANTWNVTTLGYVNGKIYHENTSNLWFVKDTSVSSGWSSSPAPAITISTPSVTPTPTPLSTTGSSTFAPSPNGRTVNSVGPVIVDAVGNSYSISSTGQVVTNLYTDASTANVIQLAYVDGLLYHKNSSNTWFNRTNPNSPWTPQSAPTLPANNPESLEGTVVYDVGPVIIDATGNTYSINGSFQVVTNGKRETFTSNVIVLYYHKGQLYQYNTSNACYTRSSPSATWLATSSPIPSAGNTGVQAYAAEKFVDSIGICHHFRENSDYSNNYSKLRDLLLALGIRHIRTGPADSGTYSGYTARMRELYALGGIKHIVVSDIRTNSANDLTNFADALGVDAISMYEGQNEPNVFLPANTFASQANTWQQTVYNTLRAKTAYDNISIASCTLTDANQITNVLSTANQVEVAACHNYPLSNLPDDPNTGNYGTGVWDLTNLCKPFGASKPAIQTETGYDTSYGGIRPNVLAKYLPRLFLNRFDAGFMRTYSYELYSEGTDPNSNEQNYGIVNHDLSITPAYTSLKNMIGFIKDHGAAYVPGKLDFTVSGNTTNVKTYLFGKRDGSFILALVLTTEIYDLANKKELTTATQNVSVHVNGKKNVSYAYPLTDSNWTSSAFTNNSINVNVGDNVLLLNIS